MTDSTQQQPVSVIPAEAVEALEGRFPDQLDAIHASLLADVRRQEDYVYARVHPVNAYSEGAEHALEIVRLRESQKPAAAGLVDREVLARVIEEEAHVDWFSGSAHELADAIISRLSQGHSASNFGEMSPYE